MNDLIQLENSFYFTVQTSYLKLEKLLVFFKSKSNYWSNHLRLIIARCFRFTTRPIVAEEYSFNSGKQIWLYSKVLVIEAPRNIQMHFFTQHHPRGVKGATCSTNFYLSHPSFMIIHFQKRIWFWQWHFSPSPFPHVSWIQWILVNLHSTCTSSNKSIVYTF